MIMNRKIVENAQRAGGNWVRSSRCVPNNNCVEVLVGPGVVGVRDSKGTDEAILAFRRDRWISFLTRTVQ